MEQSKWQLILHEDCEDAYYEITNGPISLCSPCGFVAETEDEEDAIFNRVCEALNASGIDFHSENKLELKQHIEIQELKHKTDRLKIALGLARHWVEDKTSDDDIAVINLKIINEALDENGEINPEHNAQILDNITYCLACGLPVNECNCFLKQKEAKG